MPWFVHILPVLAVQKLLKSVKIWQSCSQMYTATFYEPRQKCTFWFFQVRCSHKSRDVINFIIVACRIFSRLKRYKNYKNQLQLAKVIVKNKMSRFYGSLCTSSPTRPVVQYSDVTSVRRDVSTAATVIRDAADPRRSYHSICIIAVLVVGRW